MAVLSGYEHRYSDKYHRCDYTAEYRAARAVCRRQQDKEYSQTYQHKRRFHKHQLCVKIHLLLFLLRLFLFPIFPFGLVSGCAVLDFLLDLPFVFRYIIPSIYILSRFGII